jgi:hypothetical protein
MSTSLTTSPSPSRILITPDSPLRLDKSPLARTQRTYFADEPSFRPANLHPKALLSVTDQKVRDAVEKQLARGSSDLQDSLATLQAKRKEDGRAGLLASPRPMLAAKSGIDPISKADVAMRAASEAATSAASKVKKD